MLKTLHFFPFIKMIKALNIKNELKEIYNKVRDKSVQELENLDKEAGIDFIFMFVEKLPDAEKEVMNFLCIYLDKTLDEVNQIPLDEMVKTIYEVFKDPNFQTFFRQAVK